MMGSRLVVALGFLAFLAATVCGKEVPKAPLAWYMRETAMSKDGRLTLLDKPWWPRPKQLAEGESFTMDLNHDGRADNVVMRKDGSIIEAIDDTGQANDILNKVDHVTC